MSVMINQDGRSTELRDVINTNLALFGFEVEDLIMQGYEIHPDFPMTTWGVAYECKMVMNDRRAAVMAEHTPKLTRAEILAKARSVKADKAKDGLNANT